jgi:single-strand DNA-binding protein
MITATISGRITKDATMRQAGSSNVCSFGMASNKKIKGQDQTIFVDVSIFGKRGETLCQYLTKGSYVIVSGELSTREHNGKTYISVDGQNIDLAPGGKKRSEGDAESKGAGASNGGGYSEAEYGADAGSDDLPFAHVTYSASEPWWRF